MSLDCLPLNALLQVLPQICHTYILARESLGTEGLDLMNEQSRELLEINVVQQEKHESMELDPDDDDDSCGDNSPLPQGETTRMPRVPFNRPYIKVEQHLTYSNHNFSAYFKDLKRAYKDKRFAYVFDHMENSPTIIFMTTELVKFFNKEMKRKKSKNVISALHAIHGLTLNLEREPKIIVSVLKENDFFSYLFDRKCEYNYNSFCFLTKEIFIDILSELFDKTHPREWAKSYLKWWIPYFVTCFGDMKKPPHIYFNAIASSLVLGIEALPLKFYPALIVYFRYMIEVMPRNRLSSHYLVKVWDELMLFFRHWIRYLFCYPYLDCLNPSFSKLRFEDCKNPDPSVLQNDLGNRIIRNEMKYEYVFVEEGYVPCEFPLIPSFPKLPKIFPNLKDMENKYGELRMMFWDIIGTGYCEDCKLSECSCVSSYAIVHDVLDHIATEIEKMQQLSPESSMAFENASLNEQNKPSCPEEPQYCFDPSDEDMTPEEISDCYDSLIEHSPTISYSFSPDPILEVWEKKAMPDFTGIFSTSRKEINNPAHEQMEVEMEEQIQSVDTDSLKNVDVQLRVMNNVINHDYSVGNE